jgi:flavin-binding protein dodecin
VSGTIDPRRGDMPDNVYSISEIVGSSKESIDDAVRGAVGRAAETLHNLDWFEVTGIRGHIEDDHLCHFQVTVKVGFRLDEP